jgi:hypothetical protein
MGGTLTIRHTRLRPSVLSFGAWNADLRSGVSGTLLGPEGTAVMVVALVLPVLLEMRVSVLMVGDWSLFENCTVDASICGQVFKGARWMPWH